MKDTTFAQKIKDYRVFSIAAFITVSVLMFEFTYLIMDVIKNNPEALTMGAGTAISGIYVSISATYKWVLEFAKSRSESSN